MPGLTLGVTLAASGSIGAPDGPSASSSYGAGDPDEIMGPMETDTVFTTPRGVNLMPTGTGVKRFVDSSVSSSGDGLSLANAYKTAQEGFTALQAGDSLLIKPGWYYEKIDAAAFGANPGTSAHPVKITKLGAGEVNISAADAPGGWTVCPDAATALGNTNFANIYYVDITLAAEIGDLVDGILIEDGVVASMSMLGESTSSTDSMLIPQHTTVWWNGDDVGSSISDLTKSAETGAITATSAEWQNYTQGHLDDATVMLNGTANTYIAVPLTSHNAATGELVFTNSSGTNWSTKQIALRNLPALISAAGQWAARNTSGSTWRVYYWPRNAASIENVRISQRNACIDLNAAEHMYFFGLTLSGAGGAAPIDGRTAQGMYSTQQNIYTRDAIGVEQCKSYGHSYGGINITNTDGSQFYDNTCDTIMIGRAGDFAKCSNLVVDGNHFRMTGLTSVSLYTQTNTLFSNNHIEEVRSVHGNGSSIYLTTKNLWFHANLIETKFAIQTTMQDSGNIFFTCNVVKMGDLTDGVAYRGLEDNSNFPAGYERQGGGAGYTNVTTHFPSVPEINYISNTFLAPVGYSGDEALTCIQNENTTRCTHYAAGNIMYGTLIEKNGVDNDPSGPYTATSPVDGNNNIFLGTGATGHAYLTNGAGNELEATASNILVDPTSGPEIVANSAADVGIGDQSAFVPIAQSWLTSLPNATSIVTKDFAGQTIDWAVAPRGAYKGANVITPSAPDAFVDANWSVATSATPQSLDITIATLPANNGSNITDVEYDIDASGSWISLGAKSGTITVLMAAGSTSYDIRLRAVNSVGNGAAGNTETATSAAAGPTEPDAIYTAGELFAWFDGRNGVAHTSNAVDSWTDQSTNGYVADDKFTEPTWVGDSYIQFTAGNDDGLEGTTAINLSGVGTADIWLRIRLDVDDDFIALTNGGNNAPYALIVQSGSSSTDAAGTMGGTLRLDTLVSSTSTRGDAYTYFATTAANDWVTVLIEGVNPASLTDLDISGYVSAAFRGPISIAQLVITDNAATDVATKRTDMKTFLDSLDYT